MEILLRTSDVKMRKEDIFKRANGNESIREISNDNGFRVLETETSKILSENSHVLTFINLGELPINSVLTSYRWRLSNLDMFQLI
jgi:hypothetical protein